MFANSSKASAIGAVGPEGAEGTAVDSIFFLCWMQEEQSSLSLLPKRLRTVPQSLQNCIYVPLPRVRHCIQSIKEKLFRHFFRRE